MAGSRKQRYRKRQKRGNERWIWMVAGVAILVSFSICAHLIGDGRAWFSPQTAPTPRLKRCRSSCDHLAFGQAGQNYGSSALGASNPSSLTNLASSAVDALLVLRDGEGTASQAGDKKEINRRQKISSGSRTSGKNVPDSVVGASSRPQRLPHLIETLIGTVDENYDGNGRTNYAGTARSKKSRSIVRREKSPPTAQQKQGVSNVDDETVAMAAAAAAAAVWSKANRDSGWHRMKTLNHEWEASLQWIASWGQQQLGNRGNEKEMHADKEEKGKRQKRRKSQTHTDLEDHQAEHTPYGEHAGNYNGYKDEAGSSYWDACIAECLGETSGRDPSDEGQIVWGEVPIDQLLLHFARDAVLAFASSFFLSTGNNQESRYSFDERSHNMVCSGLFRIFVSSVCLCSLHSLWQWWWCASPVTLSGSCSFDEMPQWLLEDDDVKNPSESNRKMSWGNGKSKRKGSSGKKGRRKKNLNRLKGAHGGTTGAARAEKSSGNELVGSKIFLIDRVKEEIAHNRSAEAGCNRLPCGTGEDQPRNTTGQASTLHKSTQNRPSKVSPRKTNATEASSAPSPRKGGRLFHDLGHTARSNSRTTGDKPASTPLSASVDVELQNAIGDPLLALSSASSSPTLSPTGSQQVQTSPKFAPFRLFSSGLSVGDSWCSQPKPFGVDCSPRKNEGIYKQKKSDSIEKVESTKSDTPVPEGILFPSSGSLRQNSQIIPTDEQREEASRQLRVFQAHQLQKIIQRKKRQQEMTEPSLTHEPQSHSGLASYSSVVSPPCLLKVPNKKCSVICPPPRKDVLHSLGDITSGSIAACHQEADCEGELFPADDALLLSNMLEEDEDDDLKTTEQNHETTDNSPASPQAATFHQESISDGDPWGNHPQVLPPGDGGCVWAKSSALHKTSAAKTWVGSNTNDRVW